MGLENNFQSTVLKYLNGLPGCQAENVSGNASQSGRPDIVGCYEGRMFKIELKTTDHRNEASKKQRLELRRWKRAGCVVAVAYSLSFIQKLFEQDWNTQTTICYDCIEGGCKSWYIIPAKNLK